MEITLRHVILSNFIKLYEYLGNFQSPYEARKYFMKKIMMIILEEVFMSNRHMSDRQMYSFLKKLS